MSINKYKNAGFAGFMFFLSFIVLCYAWLPFTVKFLVDVAVTHLPFWGSFFYNLLMLALTCFISFICMVLFGGLAAINLKSK